MTSLKEYEFFYGAKASTFHNAHYLRRTLTPAEAILWHALRNRQIGGFKFRRQHPIDTFIADFYCDELLLVIELDGSIHQIADNPQYDQYRENRLSELGLTVLRFSNQDVIKKLGMVVERIKAFAP